ncbi:MAG: DEAD/DEAH box helicase family protein, partial [Antarcticimicrobium sp.]|uniref:DEAD/DEAH box helicase family protein n=1 Tax=Antarcticimicrobium sp. TaxID=2824147 RepID=UPI0026124760
MTQFAFLSPDFPDLKQHAEKAEKLALSDPRGACFWARLTLETALKSLYRRDPALRHPYERTLAALIAEPSLEALAGPAIVTKARYIKDQGNRAAHDSGKPLSPQDAAATVRELFHVCYWIARTYATGAKPDPALRFDIGKLEKSLTISASTVAQIQKIEGEVKAATKRAEQAEEARQSSEAGRIALEAELAQLRAEVAEARRANQSVPDPHDYDEATTRDAFIDLLLHEAGWPLDQPRDREFPVQGMPNQSGEGFVDYVLWGADGKPLGLVEAKRSKKEPRTGQQQAKLYADCLERMYGQRPVIFATNGYEHWIWDDQRYPPRQVSGFLKRDELELLHQRRGNRKPLADVAVDDSIAGRFYQQRAIRRVGESFEKDRQRKALLVMATGSGKTRTVIALIDQLMRANYVKRVLFLADRVALVKQAHGAFKTHLPATPSANLLQRHDPARNDHSGARVMLSTYPTMMGLIDEVKGGEKRFGPGHF